MSTATGFAHTFSFLDRLDISGGRLVASGWAVSLEKDPVAELQVSIGDTIVGRTKDLTPSPDVAADWPRLPWTSSCRFLVDTPCNAEHLRRASVPEVISVTPWIGRLPGVPLIRAWPHLTDPPTPEESNLVGGGDFLANSFLVLSLFRLLAGLRPDEAILDAGCGIGRIAYALAHYMNDRGSYAGFDASRAFIEMARRRFGMFRNFRFEHADIFNGMYNPAGKFRAEDFRFPYESGSFTFVFLNSVFTHMFAADVANYLREVRRVLRDGGRCFATFFVLDKEADRLVKEGASTLAFRRALPDGCMVVDGGSDEVAVAYRPENLLRLIASAGLRIDQTHPGLWSGRAKFLTYQDVLLLSAA